MEALPLPHDIQSVVPGTSTSPVGQIAQISAPLAVQSLPVAAGLPVPSLHVHKLSLQLDLPTWFWYLAEAHDLHTTEASEAKS